MTVKLLVRQGGGAADEVDFLDLDPARPREGAPMFQDSEPQVEMGQRWEQGTAAMGGFLFEDPMAASGYVFRPHASVKLVQSISGTDYYLAWNRVGGGWDVGRRATLVGGDDVEHTVQLMDCNLDLRGLPFQDGWSRPAETTWERLQALAAAKLSGSGSTAPIHRSTTNITVDRFTNGHLVDATSPVDMDANDYPPGTQVDEILLDIMENWGKGWGVTLHHEDGVGTHRCLLVQDYADLAKFTSDLRISDQLTDWDPDDLTAPTLEPHWLRGKGKKADNDEVISGLISIYGGTNDDPRTVLVETGEAPEDWEVWYDVYNDDLAKNETQATRRANHVLNDRKRPYVTNVVSILLLPEQTTLITAGQAIQIKSVVVNQDSLKHEFTWRRIAEIHWQPVADGRWWAHLDLDRPRNSRPRAGGGQPQSTTPKPAPDHEPDPGDTLSKFYNANDPGGDAINWDGILTNQGGSGDGAAGTDWYHFKSAAPDEYQHTWAFSAGAQLRVSGYIGCDSDGQLKIAFTDLAAGSDGAISPIHILATHVLSPVQPGHEHAPEWTLFSAGPFTAPVGTTSVALGRTVGVSFDELSIYTVDGGTVTNDEQAVDYDGYPHTSPFFLPSDYVEARLDELQDLVAEAEEDINEGRVHIDDLITLSRRPLIWANRGDLKDDGNTGDSYPENSLEGFLQSVLKGVDGVEIDVGQSSDGTWHAMHDTTLTRTTNLSGNISAASDATIAGGHIDAGFGYNTVRHGTSIGIPTLQSIIDALTSYDPLYLLEFKSGDIVELASFMAAQNLAERTILVGTASQVASLLTVDARFNVMVNLGTGADGDIDVAWLSAAYSDVTSLSVVTALAPQRIHSYIPIAEFSTADEDTIFPNMYDRGVRSWETYDPSNALALRDGLTLTESDPVATAHIAATTDSHDASAISIVDAGGYYTGTDVEAALQEVGAGVGGSGSFVTVDAGVVTYDHSGADVDISIDTVWGIDTDGSYYDDAGAVDGEQAALMYDPDSDAYLLIPYNPA